jgi:hypothetical protein
MGPRLKLPRYVHGFVDRHGKPRFYFRRAGFDIVALPGLPYSPEFMAAYGAALAGQRFAPASRVAAGTMDALALSYFASHAAKLDPARPALDDRAVLPRARPQTRR